MAMRLTKAGDYAIRGMLYLAEQPEGRVTTISEIALKRDIPRGFLAKIFQTLAKSGLVYSTQGNTGGFLLGKSKDKITLREIVEAVDGPVYLNYCLIHRGECPWNQ
ncbi:MAG: RrF2 family transcriptional regulator, partial [Candidatus Zixiibacteriota bacterium]